MVFYLQKLQKLLRWPWLAFLYIPPYRVKCESEIAKPTAGLLQLQARTLLHPAPPRGICSDFASLESLLDFFSTSYDHPDTVLTI